MEPARFSARLPAARTPLIGRDDALATLRALVLHADERLLTLTGVGGGGKTRLALHLAADLAPAFHGHVWLIDLAPIADPALVPIAVADALGLRGAEGQTPLELLATVLAPQPALLVLDNCEHLIEACAALADHLLTACPALRILATSRESLQILGERLYRVPPLAVPDPDRSPTPETLTRSPAVQLFVARVQAVAPDFRLTTENAPIVARICDRLDGIPLALELAAARARVLTVQEILDRLDDAFHLLARGSRVGPTRQQTLRTTLDWSDALLSGTERAVFSRLGVFAGAFSLGAAEAICADADVPTDAVLDVLTRLVDKSLVAVDTGDAAAWYRLLEPVRQYARQRLTARGEAADAEARHGAFYAALAERAEPALNGPDQAIWLARLEREQGNLRAALGWALERRGETEVGLRIATALVPFWEAHGHLVEGRRWLLAALAASPATVLRTLRMLALSGAGRLAHFHAAYDEAEQLHTESLALARAIGDERGIATALTDLGMVARLRGDLARSQELLEEGRARFGDLGDEAGVAYAVLNLGSTISSRALVEEGVARYEALGDLRHAAIGQALLGRIATLAGESEQAIGLHCAALRTHAHLGDRWSAVFDLLGLVEALLAGERTAEAVRFFAAAQALIRTLGSPVGETTYRHMIAAMARLRDDVRYARHWAEGAARSFDETVMAALALEAPTMPERRAAPQGHAGAEALTRREREIARLLAHGASDRQIAEALYISVSTVNVHVHHILQKLGLRSRWQVADWLAAQDASNHSPR